MAAPKRTGTVLPHCPADTGMPPIVITTLPTSKLFPEEDMATSPRFGELRASPPWDTPSLFDQVRHRASRTSQLECHEESMTSGQATLWPPCSWQARRCIHSHSRNSPPPSACAPSGHESERSPPWPGQSPRPPRIGVLHSWSMLGLRSRGRGGVSFNALEPQ